MDRAWVVVEVLYRKGEDGHPETWDWSHPKAKDVKVLWSCDQRPIAEVPVITP